MNQDEAIKIKTALGISSLAIENCSQAHLPGVAGAAMTNSYQALLLFSSDHQLRHNLEKIRPGHLDRVSAARYRLVSALHRGPVTDLVCRRIKKHIADLFDIAALRAAQLRYAA